MAKRKVLRRHASPSAVHAPQLPRGRWRHADAWAHFCDKALADIAQLACGRSTRENTICLVQKMGNHKQYMWRLSEVMVPYKINWVNLHLCTICIICIIVLWYPTYGHWAAELFCHKRPHVFEDTLLEELCSIVVVWFVKLHKEVNWRNCTTSNFQIPVVLLCISPYVQAPDSICQVQSCIGLVDWIWGGRVRGYKLFGVAGIFGGAGPKKVPITPRKILWLGKQACFFTFVQ